MVFDQSQLRDLCTQQSFQRGLRYFEEGRVKIKEASCSRIAAVVLGNDSYRVEIDLDRLSARCSCPYDLEGYCKHIVATFLAVKREPKEVERMVSQVSAELESVQALLVRTDPDAVSDFLLQELESNPCLEGGDRPEEHPGAEPVSQEAGRDVSQGVLRGIQGADIPLCGMPHGQGSLPGSGLNFEGYEGNCRL